MCAGLNVHCCHVGVLDVYAGGKDNRSDTISEQCNATLEQYDATQNTIQK